MNFIQKMWLDLTNTPREKAIMQMCFVFVVEGVLAAGSAVLENFGIVTPRQMVAIVIFVIVSSVTNGAVKYLHANATSAIEGMVTEALATKLPAMEQEVAEELHIASAKGVLFPADLSGK